MSPSAAEPAKKAVSAEQKVQQAAEKAKKAGSGAENEVSSKKAS
ncbi:hypothetical protein [Paenibacillus ferrarius]|nr:hypothetical protein [Paenibacillus ferrarius]